MYGMRWFWVLMLAVASCDSAPPASQTDDRFLATITVNPAEVLADGKASARIVVEVRSTSDDSVAAGVELKLQSSRGDKDNFDPVEGKTDENGKLAAEISSTAEGEATLTVLHDGAALCGKLDNDQCDKATAQITFVSDTVDPPPPDCKLSADGKVIDLVDLASGNAAYPVTAPVGTDELLVAYNADDSGGMFFGERSVEIARYDAQAKIVGSNTTISAAGTEAGRPSLAAGKDGFALVYSDGDAIQIALLDADGKLSSGPTPVASGIYHAPAVAALPDGKYGVAFSGRADTNAKRSTWLALVNDSGAVANTVEVSTDPSGDSTTFPAIVADDSGVGVAWQDRRNGSFDLFFRRVNADGSFASDELLVQQDELSVSVAVKMAWTGKEYGLAFADTRDEHAHYQVYLARIKADGSAAIAQQAITAADGNADTPAIIFVQGRYWVSWVEKPWSGDPTPFSLQATSPAIDAGADVGLPFNGPAPDIGAKEFGGPEMTSEYATSIHLALVDPAIAEPVSVVKVADTVGFSALPTIAPSSEAVMVSWFDTGAERRTIHAARLQCQPE